jgi:hypothetical protein
MPFLAQPNGVRSGHKIGTVEKSKNASPCKLLVRKEGLEPSRFYPPDPKSGASANSATFALPRLTLFYNRLN